MATTSLSIAFLIEARTHGLMINGRLDKVEVVRLAIQYTRDYKIKSL